MFDCIQSNNVRGDSKLFDKCFSMDKPERFSGTWSTDFEWSQFYSGQTLSGDKAWRYQNPPVVLVTEGSKLEKYVNADLANVVEVEFIGRRPSCNLKGHKRYIVVDQVITDRVIEASPSKR
jgi:hypothetical protein